MSRFLMVHSVLTCEMMHNAYVAMNGCYGSWTVAERAVLRTTGAVPGTTTHHLPAETSCRPHAVWCSMMTHVTRSMLTRSSVRSRQLRPISNRTRRYTVQFETRFRSATQTQPRMLKLRSCRLYQN